MTQATWQGGLNGTQVAFVTIIGGTHTYPQPNNQTGYDFTDGLWAFCSQFLSDQPAAPVIVSQPLKNIQPAGQPASFRVVASGTAPLSYQWQRNGQDLPGETRSWLTLPAVTNADQGAVFQAVVRNAAGAVTSAAASLQVVPPPSGQPSRRNRRTSRWPRPARPIRVQRGGQRGLLYHWRCNCNNLPVPPRPTTHPGVTPFDSGAFYTVQVTDTAAPPSARRRRWPDAPRRRAVIVANPVRARLVVGQPGQFSVSAWSPTPLRYQWQKGPALGHLADIPGATQANYAVPPVTLDDHHTLYRCVVSNAVGSIASACEMTLVTPAARAPHEFIFPLAAAAQTACLHTQRFLRRHGPPDQRRPPPCRPD